MSIEKYQYGFLRWFFKDTRNWRLPVIVLAAVIWCTWATWNHPFEYGGPWPLAAVWLIWVILVLSHVRDWWRQSKGLPSK